MVNHRLMLLNEVCISNVYISVHILLKYLASRLLSLLSNAVNNESDLSAASTPNNLMAIYHCEHIILAKNKITSFSGRPLPMKVCDWSSVAKHSFRGPLSKIGSHFNGSPFRP